jgi:D-inositol-3-phosphate glycosyltransferase
MKAIYYGDVPLDVEVPTTGPRTNTIFGARVYRTGLLKALLQYGTYDQIFMKPCPRLPEGDVRDTALYIQNASRVAEMHEHQLEMLQQYSPAVLLTPAGDLGRQTRLRQLTGRPSTSIVGPIHSLNYSFMLRDIFGQLVAPLERHDALICSSHAGKKVFENYVALIQARLAAAGWPQINPRFQLPVIPLGVEVSEFQAPQSPRPADTRATLDLGSGPIVLFFGRFSATSKGDLCPLIVAFSLVSRRYPDATLLLAGDDTHFNMEPFLKEFAARVAPGARVRTVANPSLETKHALYAAADIFVSPSDSLQETFGITVIEAMAARLPAVVSDWNGYKELVEHGRTGLRVRTTLPVYDARFDSLKGSGSMLTPDLLAATTMIDVNALADALETLVARPDMRREMGEEAYRRAEAHYDWPVVIAAYEELFAELAREAEHADPQPPGVELDNFGYREIFSHYPTDYLPEDAELRLTAAGQTWAHDLRLLSTSADLASVFREDVFESVLSRLRDGRSMNVATLLARLDANTATESTLNLAHLCRLIKYGLVESPRPAATEPAADAIAAIETVGAIDRVEV